MYFQNVGYHWSKLDEYGAPGAIFRATGQDFQSANRRDLESPPEHLLFDPQLYFLDFDISPDGHSKVLTNLCTYPWFGMAPEAYDSDEGKLVDWKRQLQSDLPKLWKQRRSPIRAWEATVRSCVSFQLQFGCTAIVLPATLISDPESDLEAEGERLDVALREAKRLDSKASVFASIPIDEGALRHRAPNDSPLLETIADVVSARRGLAGAYIPLISSGPDRDRITNANVAGAMIRLTRDLASTKLKVVVNFVETLGLACLAVGGFAYASAYGSKDRRLAASDFADGGGGRAYPKFLSLELGVDLYPERDLDRMVQRRLLRLVRNDETPASAPLLSALAAGKKSSDVAEWEERQNNTARAVAHYAQLNTARAREMRSPDDALDWLQRAESGWQYVRDRFRSDPLEGDGSHLAPWRSALEALLD